MAFPVLQTCLRFRLFKMKLQFLTSKSDDFEKVMSIRNTVFEMEQNAIESEEIDLYDKSDETIYLLIYDGENAVATGRIAFTSNGVKIGRIAVLKSQRGKGTGALLVNALCEKCESLGYSEIHVDSQLHAIPFYEKQGFRLVSNEKIMDRGIVHLPMLKEV